MRDRLPHTTVYNQELTRKLEALQIEFVDLFTCHKNMVENESVILTSLYLEKLGKLQLELFEKQTEVARLKLKMNLLQAAINRNEHPDLVAVEQEIDARFKDYYAQIRAQAAALDEANRVLSNLLPEEEAQKLKETFRVLCKRLHPDLNPSQTEEEKDLFIRVKAAYDLQQIDVLQNILLYLSDSTKEKLVLISTDEKLERIKHLENQIMVLKGKIAQLKQNFPFSMQNLIFDKRYIAEKQEELRKQIKETETEIDKYLNIINILTDE
jgi:hypothetical protein